MVSGVVLDRDDDHTPDKAVDAQRIKANKFGVAPAIPSHFYKVVMHKTESGDMQSIAILLPHVDQKMTRQKDMDYLTQHIVTIEKIEELESDRTKKMKNAPIQCQSLTHFTR